MKFKLIFILLCFISLNIYAQGGTIKGNVTDAQDSVSLIGANVIILGTKLGAPTDINGFYEIKNIPPGTYTIKVAFVGYTALTLEGARVTNAGPLILDFELEWDSNSPFDIIQEKPVFERMRRGCGIIPWTVDMIPIKEYYHINLLDSIRFHPPEVKPVIVKDISK